MTRTLLCTFMSGERSVKDVILKRTRLHIERKQEEETLTSQSQAQPVEASLPLIRVHDVWSSCTLWQCSRWALLCESRNCLTYTRSFYFASRSVEFQRCIKSNIVVHTDGCLRAEGGRARVSLVRVFFTMILHILIFLDFDHDSSG